MGNIKHLRNQCNKTLFVYLFISLVFIALCRNISLILLWPVSWWEETGQWAGEPMDVSRLLEDLPTYGRGDIQHDQSLKSQRQHS